MSLHLVARTGKDFEIVRGCVCSVPLGSISLIRLITRQQSTSNRYISKFPTKRGATLEIEDVLLPDRMNQKTEAWMNFSRS